MIADARAAVAVLLADAFAGTYPVHTWLPADTAEVPAIVVGRPSLARSDEVATAIAYSFPVFVIGRRLNDDDSAEELDSVTDEVLTAVKAFVGGVVVSPLQRLVVASVEPDVLQVANDEVPAYRITLDATSILC